MLYDARRPFEDRLDGPEQRSEVLIAAVPAASLLRACPGAERLCAKPVPLSGTVARAISAFVRSAIEWPGAAPAQNETDIVEYLAALLHLASGTSHQLEEVFKVGEIVKADGGWRGAMMRRGLSDEEIELVQVDPFSAGYFNREVEKGRRLVSAVSYWRKDLKDNGYAHPIEGVVALVDLVENQSACGRRRFAEIHRSESHNRK